MAIDIVSNAYLNLGSAAVSSTPITMFCWVRPLSAASYYTLITINRTPAQGFANKEHFVMELNPGGILRANHTGPSGTASSTTTTVTANVWNACGAIFTSNSSRTAYIGGVAGTANTTAISAPTVGDTTFGITIVAGGGLYRPLQGCMAYAAIWNVALSAQEMSDLGDGTKIPSDIPTGLILDCPMLSDATAGDNAAGTDLTTHGSITTCASSPIVVPASSVGADSRIIGF